MDRFPPTRFGTPLIAVGLLLALAACDNPFAPGAAHYERALAERKGELATVERWAVDADPGQTIHDFRLVSTSGLVVRGRYRTHALGEAGERQPLVVLLGGIERGGEAVDLIPADVAVTAAALWYPEGLTVEDPAEALVRLDELADLAWDIPASVLLALDFLAAQPEVDTTRVAAVGASFGGFFVPAAAAADPRIHNTGLLYAGGDMTWLLAAHLTNEIPPAAATLGAEMATLRLQRLEPTRYVGDIAPRHLLIVNGLFDDLVPPRSARALMDAARQPKDLVWLPSGHLNPRDADFLQELVDTALARLPILRRP